MLIYTLKTQWKDGIDDDCKLPFLTITSKH